MYPLKNKMTSYNNFDNPTHTAMSPLNHSTYRDPNAGGQWNCGNIRGYGAAPFYQLNQFSAATPVCSNDRFAVRLAYRDTFGPGCCTAEDYVPRIWSWPYEPLTVSNQNSITNLNDRILFREVYNHPMPYSWPTINDN